MVSRRNPKIAKTIPTLELVAKSAGVSPATVSRVLNGTVKVSPENERVVRLAIKKHNYIPNITARHLAGGRSGLVALILEELNEEFFLNPFWGYVVQGFTSTISDSKMQPILIIRPKTGSERSLFESLRHAQVDGIAIFSWYKPIKSFEKLIPKKMAVVFGGDIGGSEKYPYVDVDNIKGGYLAGKHLIDQGCRHVVTITGDLKLQSARDRLLGFEKAMSEAGRPMGESSIINGDYSLSTAEKRTRELLSSGEKFDGIFAGNDLIAIGAINILLQNKIKVPEQVKVIGFDDSTLAARNSPSLSTINQPMREFGAEVAKVLIQILEGRKVERKLLDVSLVVRESSAKTKHH